MNSFKKRVLVIGLDCADFKFITPLVKEGRLPNIARLLQNGVSANLLSTIPPTSAPAWASFMTGKNPGKTGIFDFQVRVEKSYETRFVNSNDIRSKTLWRLLSEAGKKVIVVNVPLTYPPEKVNGILISGLLTPPGSVFTYPPELSRDLMDKGYTIEGKIYANQNKTLISLLNADREKVKVAKHIAKRTEWDFLMIVFTSTDRVIHSMWDDTSKIYNCYEYVDMLIGDIINTVDKEVIVFLMSDHGANNNPWRFYVNDWLARMSFLEYIVTDKKPSSGTVNIGNVEKSDILRSLSVNLSKLLRKIGVGPDIFIKMTYIPLLKWIREIVPISFRRSLFSDEAIEIVWGKTQIYLLSNDSLGLRVNLEGREPKGIVKIKEYKNLCRTVISQLEKLRNPFTNEKVIDKVWRKENLYKGEFQYNAPDLIIEPKGFIYYLDGSKKGKSIFGANVASFGKHRMEGIFISSGKGIKRGYLVDDLSIFDLTPTILHILDVPIPEDVDGRIIREIFESSNFLKKEIRYQESSMIIKRENDILEEGKDDESIKKRLSALGYL